MRQHNDIQHQAEAALNSLNGLSKASPGPYFFTRLQARMNRGSKNIWDQLVFTLNRPVVAIGLAILVIAINASVVLQEHESASMTDQTELTVTEEYNLASNTYLDEVNQEP